MSTLEVLVTAGPGLQDLLVAEFADLGYDAFQSTDTELRSYVSAELDSPELRAVTRAAVARMAPTASVEFSTLPARNWNEEWERSAVPVEVGRFVILPSWTDSPPGARTPLWIDPKMSFGTGHHESTRLALRLMEPEIRPGAAVLDAGTGTGVLAIAAALLGAGRVIAFDIDEWSARNCTENIERNGVSESVRFVYGSLDRVEGTGFDIAVANINRNVLLDLIPRLAERLAPSGVLIVAGLLLTDRDAVLTAARSSDLASKSEAEEGEWWAAVLDRNGG